MQPDRPAAIDLAGVAVDVVGPGGTKVRLLEGATWRVEAGQTWVVLGPNGAGKSTLLSVAGARRFPAEGSAAVLGHRLGTTDLRELRRAVGHVDVRVGDDLGDHLSARVAVVTGQSASTVPLWSRYVDADWQRADDLLRLVGVGKASGQRFGTLSQGERARVLIARALMPGPDLLILDEPAAGLDLVGREQLLVALDELRRTDARLAIVLVTHHVEEIPASASHAVVVADGRLVAAGPVDIVVTPAVLSQAYGAPVSVRCDGRRFTARVTGP